MRRRLVVGNWKMNGSVELCRSMIPLMIEAAAGGIESASGRAVELVICPPALHIAAVATMAASSALSVGAQNVSALGNGAHTGEISATMLRELGCRHAIVGHSERRAQFGESDADAAEKARACVANGITPIVCVGETETQRFEGRTREVVARQVGAVVARLGAADLARCAIAYEPVWAIGTGKTATPAEAQAVHAFIRACVSAVDPAVARAVPILYGGSLKATNAVQLFAMPDVDGGLVGGASLQAAEFLRIYEAACDRRVEQTVD